MFPEFVRRDNWWTPQVVEQIRDFTARNAGIPGAKCDEKVGAFWEASRCWLFCLFWLNIFNMAQLHAELFHKKMEHLSNQISSDPISVRTLSQVGARSTFLVPYVAPPLPSYGYYCTYNYVSTATSTAKTHHYQH